MPRNAQHGPGGDTHELARQIFWELCKRVHSEIKAGSDPSAKIARNGYFLPVMDEILAAAEMERGMAAAGAR